MTKRGLILKRAFPDLRDHDTLDPETAANGHGDAGRDRAAGGRMDDGRTQRHTSPSQLCNRHYDAGDIVGLSRRLVRILRHQADRRRLDLDNGDLTRLPSVVSRHPAAAEHTPAPFLGHPSASR